MELVNVMFLSHLELHEKNFKLIIDLLLMNHYSLLLFLKHSKKEF